MAQQTVLYVEDDSAVAYAVGGLLSREGHRTLLAASAEQALELLRREPVDLVISDHGLPFMTGVELLSTVSRERPEVVRFLVTGNATLPMALDAINKGSISRFFLKPLDFPPFVAAIHRALMEKALLDEAWAMYRAVKRQAAVLEAVAREHPEAVARARAAVAAASASEGHGSRGDLGAFLRRVRAMIDELADSARDL